MALDDRRRRHAVLPGTAPADASSASAASGGGPGVVPGTRSPAASASGRDQALGRDPQPPLVARADGRAEQRPGQLHEALVGERPQAPQQGGPALGAGEVADGTGPPGQLVEQVDLGRGQPRARRGPSAPRRPASPPPSAPAARASRAAASRGSRRPAEPGSARPAPRRTPARARGSSGPSERTRAAIGRTPPPSGATPSPTTMPIAWRPPRPNGTSTASPGSRSPSPAGARYVYVRGPGPAGASTATSTRRPSTGAGAGPPRSRPSVGGTALPSADADPPVRVAALLLLDDRLDLRGRPVDLAGLVDHDAVVVALARELDGGVALPDLQLVGGLGGAGAEALEQGLQRRRARGTRAAPRARAA